MKLRFDPALAHQRHPVAAIVDLFADQGWRGEGVGLSGAVAGGSPSSHALDTAALRSQLQAVQRRAGLPQDDALAWIDAPGSPTLRGGVRFCNFTVEMETGTGKTYVYLRTALTLAARYGLRKYVVVVPSVAIREGVLKTLEVTREHFSALLPRVPYRYFAYDGGQLSRVRAFATDDQVDFMVVTIDAFNKSSNLLRRPHDGFGGAVPLDLVRSLRPVVILDEPHNLDSELSRRSLADLHPLFALRYSATPRGNYGLVHRLTPAQAHAAGLVKRIEVASVAVGQTGREAACARLDAAVRIHVQRQVQLRARGIKVLTLVLVDRVDSYVSTDDPWIRDAFDAAWRRHAGADPAQAERDAADVRAAYFAPRAGRAGAAFVDSSTGAAKADRAAYALIMRDKERLLSLAEPVAFVFSHSALREGWDNPNVAVVCALGQSRSARRRRQEIGRGLRLCVDDEGRRVTDPACNVLTVVADEDYGTYVRGLQAEESGRHDDGTPVAAAGQGTLGARAPAEPTRASAPLSEAAIAGICEQIAKWQPTPASASVEERAWPDAVDLVLTALLRADPPRLVSRATALRLVSADRFPARWRTDPEAAATAVAGLVATAFEGADPARSISSHGSGAS